MVNLVYFIATILVISSECKTTPSIHIHNRVPSDTSSFGFYTSVDRPDLTPIFPYYFSASSISVCGSGLWLLHWDFANYTSNPLIFYNNTGCSSFTDGDYLPGSVRLVRDIQNNVATRSLNVYSGINFTNNATTFENDQSHVSIRFSSVVLTGSDSVQFYLVENFMGFSFCLRAGFGKVYSSIADLSNEGMKPGDVRSFRFGCISANKLI